ncbi:hypothetical protein AAKU55_004482 [Oxalobacteraceae bacterium GrIS 1.11]
MIVVSDAAFWLDALAKPLIERLGAAPDALIAYVALVNAAMGYASVPHSVEAPPDFQDDVRTAIAEMPQVVKDLLDGPLLGVYFGTDLGSSAVTDIVVKDTGEILGIVTGLDLGSFLNRSANEWATWKENTPFTPAPPYSLDVRIEEEGNDNRKNAIQYLLLHEFGHVLTAGRSFLPSWWLDTKEMKTGPEYSFLPLSWQVTDDKRIVPLEHNEFALRSRVVYYTGAQLAADEMVAVYEALRRTSFATLYGATNAYDDFAEAFTSYVHTVLMKKPLAIRICRDGEVLMPPESFWNEPRGAEKLDLFRRFLGGAE